jgi:hypothetical protein
MWVDEQIWGHRLWDAQSPWLIFLEFLTVAEACHREGQLLKRLFVDDQNRPAPLSYRPYKRMYLRNILYNNEEIFRIADRYSDDATAWRLWLQWMQDHAQAVSNLAFSYLKSRFRTFHQFASLVGMIRSSTIESGSNKRWSSRFVFPFGRHAIYEDLNVSGGSTSREYIYFGLPGELLYQMLGRSRHSEGLRTHIAMAFEGTDSCDRLLALMQPDIPEDFQSRGNSYLPYANHPTFDALGQDWLNVFDLGLPRFDAYPHLAILAALHLVLYQLVVAAELCEEPRPHFICEVVAPRKTLVRELSTMSYLQNSQLSSRAVEEYVKRIGETDEWREASTDPAGFATCRDLMREHVRWPRADEDYDGPSDASALLKELRKAALARHRQHVGNVHRSYGGGAGLVSRRGTNRLRYAPTDDLLKALILANVSVRMEYGEFLALLYERYGLVFGEREAKQVLGAEEFDKRAFQANSERLESRLRTLGMLRRLSDACAYVENPLRKAAS